MTSFDWKKILKTLSKMAGMKPPEASLDAMYIDAMDIMRLAGGMVAGVLVKDYAVYKNWINE